MNNAIHTSTPESRSERYARAVSNQHGQGSKFPLLLILLHIPLGVVLYNTGSLGLIHPLVCFAIGMRRALLVEEDLKRVAEVAAYIVGVEVLWRMTKVPIFWEFGKYSVAIILITALARRGLWRIPAFALFYFVLLLPSSISPLIQNDLITAKDILSSNLLGPFLLLISSWFFSNLSLTRSDIKKLLLTLILPLLSVAVAAFFYTVTVSEIEFNGESNLLTSGGFGPNQVSAMLGLGAFLCVACILLFKNSIFNTLFFGGLTLLFTAQSVLTFSRGGMYNAIGGILLIIVIQMRNLKSSLQRLLPLLGIVALFVLLFFPYLDNFTGGALMDRFKDTDPTKRSDIVVTDIKIFAANPVLGVGVGNAYEERAKYLNYKAMSHTEFTRLVAEHGTFGLAAIGAMLFMFVFNFQRQDSVFGKAFVAGFVAWSVMFMLNAGMRLAAPSLLWGMSYLTLVNFQTSRPGMPQNREQCAETSQ